MFLFHFHGPFELPWFFPPKRMTLFLTMEDVDANTSTSMDRSRTPIRPTKPVIRVGRSFSGQETRRLVGGWETPCGWWLGGFCFEKQPTLESICCVQCVWQRQCSTCLSKKRPFCYLSTQVYTPSSGPMFGHFTSPFSISVSIESAGALELFCSLHRLR